MFLSLSGLFILALIGTLLETARYTVCQNYVTRTLQVGSEALLTEYSRPLYDHYGLFFIEDAGTPFEHVISRYAADTLEQGDKGTSNFLPGHLTGVNVKKKTYLGDYEARALQEEITDYMGRVATKEALDKWRKKCSQLSHVDKDAKAIEHEVETEKKEAELDKQILQLMKLVDGISVYDGTIYCEAEFVKMFAVGEKKGQNFSVTEGSVWKKVKEKLDATPKKWDVKNKRQFLNRIRRVKTICKRAIQIGNALTAKYNTIHGNNGKHDSMVANLVAALPSLQNNLSVLEQTETILCRQSIKESKEQLKTLWKEYDTKSLVFDYTGIKERGGGENPKDSFCSAWNKGILNLVCKDTKKLSKKTMANPDSFAKLYQEEEGEKENYGERVDNFATNDSVSLSGVLGNIGSYATDEFCLDKYLSKHFGSYVKTMSSAWKQSLNYGLEYVVSGKGSDEDNLKSVLNRILLIRTVVNFATIYRDKVKKAEAEAAALAVVGFTGLQPLIKLMQTLILLTWSMVESFVDIAALLLQKHVPLIKKKKEITTSFAQVFQITRSAIVGRASKLAKEKKNSFGYTDYVFLFLSMTKQSTRRYRIMDLIQHDMQKNGYRSFQLGNCVHAIEVQGNASFPSVFFRMPVLETMLGRKLQTYAITSHVTVSY